MKRPTWQRMWAAWALLAAAACGSTAAEGGGATAPGDDAGADGTIGGSDASGDGAAGNDLGGDALATGEVTSGADTTLAACPEAALLLDVAKGQGAGSGYAAATLSGSCTDKTFTVTGNGMPFYSFVAMTPNALQPVTHTWTITRTPAIAEKTTELPLLGVAGFTIAGIPFYGPNEATQPAEEIYGDPVYNGLMDGCMAHTSPQEYHNHALAMKCLTADALKSAQPWTLAEPAADKASPIIGWALDGFPVYGPYGCVDKACAQVAEMKSGYVKTGDPKTYAWKAYTFTAQPSDPTVLDVCNGRVQPDGSYGYHATSGFPYILGCYKGTPTAASGTQPGGGGGTGTGGGTGPTTCTSDGDCSGKCPAGSTGCGCADTPQGKLCIPTCTQDSECGKTPDGTTTTCKQGYCRP